MPKFIFYNDFELLGKGPEAVGERPLVKPKEVLEGVMNEKSELRLDLGYLEKKMPIHYFRLVALTGVEDFDESAAHAEVEHLLKQYQRILKVVSVLEGMIKYKISVFPKEDRPGTAGFVNIKPKDNIVNISDATLLGLFAWAEAVAEHEEEHLDTMVFVPVADYFQVDHFDVADRYIDSPVRLDDDNTFFLEGLNERANQIRNQNYQTHKTAYEPNVEAAKSMDRLVLGLTGKSLIQDHFMKADEYGFAATLGQAMNLLMVLEVLKGNNVLDIDLEAVKNGSQIKIPECLVPIQKGEVEFTSFNEAEEWVSQIEDGLICLDESVKAHTSEETMRIAA